MSLSGVPLALNGHSGSGWSQPKGGLCEMWMLGLFRFEYTLVEPVLLY